MIIRSGNLLGHYLRLLNEKREYIFVLSVMGLGLVLSVAGFVVVQSREELLARDEFQQLSRERVLAVNNDFNSNLEVLYNIRSLFASSKVVGREDFNNFVEHSLSQNKNILALEWVPRVLGSERAQYEESMQEEGFADFRFVEQQARQETGLLYRAADRDEHFPVYYLEPSQGNETVLGYDLASDRSRMEALAKSRDTGVRTATGLLHLIENSREDEGFLVSLPVYRNGSPVDTVAARRENLRGFIVGIYGVGAIVDPLVDAKAPLGLLPEDAEEYGSSLDLGLHVEVYDRTAPEDSQLFSHSEPLGDHEDEYNSGFSFTEVVNVAGRIWEIEVTAAKPLWNWQPWGLLVGGLLLTGLLVSYIWSAVNRTTTVERLVGLRTQELSQANQQMIEEVAFRRQAESQLKESEAGVRAILDATVDGIITIDEKGTIESFNLAAESLFGYFSQDIIGQNIKVLMPEHYEVEHDGYLHNYLSTGHKKIIGGDRQVEGMRVDGSTFPMDLAVSEVMLDDRRVFSGIVRDISERKQLENEIDLYTESLERAYADLQDLDVLKDNFLSSVSHELRTPLTAIKGSAEILLDGEGVNEEIQEEFLSIINTECDRLTRLINDVLDLARIDAGKERWDDAPNDMGEIVKSAVSSIQTLAMQKDLEVVVDLDPDLSGLMVDHDKMIQVMTNLLSNAIKFTPNGGKITVTGMNTEPDSGRGSLVEIKVTDSGIGMEPGDLPRIFEKFKQVDDVAVDVQRGTGLGLPICKEIIAHYDGKIWAESELGKGSSLTFSIPVTLSEMVVNPKVDRNTDTSTYVRTSPHQKTILVVDDESDIRRLLHHEFTMRGYRVIEASNGGEAIEVAREQHPDLITMDVLMPVLDGYDAIRLLKAEDETKDIPILILSIVENAERGLELGANQFISKPFAVEEMLESVTKLLSGTAKQVLIADDDVSLAETLRFQLEQKGFLPSVVHDGKSVLESIKTNPPDLVVLDLLMPEGDGFETLIEMKRRPAMANIPVVVLSGLDIDGVRVRALSLGATDFVPKAAGLSRLYEEIESILT